MFKKPSHAAGPLMYLSSLKHGKLNFLKSLAHVQKVPIKINRPPKTSKTFKDVQDMAYFLEIFYQITSTIKMWYIYLTNFANPQNSQNNKNFILTF
jgi:hypothetical protein